MLSLLSPFTEILDNLVELRLTVMAQNRCPEPLSFVSYRLDEVDVNFNNNHMFQARNIVHLRVGWKLPRMFWQDNV